MQTLVEVISNYVRETRRLESLPSSTETTFYPDLKLLLGAVLKSERLPFDVITGTSEGGGRRRDMPDFVLGDSSLFVGVYGEVKRADTSLADLAVSTEQNDQIGRYLSQTGVVLLSNVRGIGLLSCDPSFTREGGKPVPPRKRVLEKTVDLWSAVSGSGAKQKVDPSAVEDLISIVTRAVTDLAHIGSPADLAKILARQARDAKAAMPDDLKPVKPLLDDYRQALGLAFAIDDEKGARFFRSSLVQSIFYALFAAWILWDKEAAPDASFEVEDAHQYLPDTDKDGSFKRDEFGRIRKKQRGESLLYKEFGVRKQLLDDLYIRFIRLAEERIGEAAEYGVVSYISNSSYLTGRSHPMMRRSLLSNFHAVWIDNLNGDKYRTGKIIPKGLPGAGTRDDSAFTTEMAPRGIQPGTTIATWVKRTYKRTKPEDTAVFYRDLWGPAAVKRRDLLASLPAGSAPKGSAVPVYEPVKPSQDNRWRLGPKTIESGFEAWPSLEELFPISFQGVNPNRGLEGGIIDTDRAALERRLRAYFAADTFRAAKKASEEIATVRARYDPEKVWLTLKADGHFRKDAIVPLLTFPFDRRYIYYVASDKWLNEARPEFARNAADNEWLITVPEPRKASETWPMFGTELVNLHVHERGSVVFPRETRGDDLLSDRDANLPEATWRILRDHFGLKGERRNNSARTFVGRLFRVVLAVLHAPSYQVEHKSALAADWAHLPIPKDAKLFDRLATTGEQVARLLDAARDAGDVIQAVIGADRVRALGPLKRIDGKQVRPDDLKITVTYWGGGKGRWKHRPFIADELPAIDYGDAWGERTGDLFLNDDAYFANVPELIWNYQLGGYPVLKKWLGYRQADRRDGNPLTDDERRWFRQVIQRIAALLALGRSLDALYQDAAANAFAAEELQMAR